MNDNRHTRITGKETLISELGYFPEFCDAKITEFIFHPYTEIGAELSILLHYIDMDLNLDMNIKIVFHSISDMGFNEFGVENVIDRLSIDESNESALYFEIEACAGLYGCCNCKAVDIELISSKEFK